MFTKIKKQQIEKETSKPLSKTEIKEIEKEVETKFESALEEATKEMTIPSDIFEIKKQKVAKSLRLDKQIADTIDSYIETMKATYPEANINFTTVVEYCIKTVLEQK